VKRVSRQMAGSYLRVVLSHVRHSGNRCKFSHDKNVERKAEKANIYQDQREDGDVKAQGKLITIMRSRKRKMSLPTALEKDTMDKWDEEKLRSVVTSKGGNPRTTTDVSSALRAPRFHSMLTLETFARLFASSSFRQSRIRSMVGCEYCDSCFKRCTPC
jgi:hypothetical protein